MSEATVEGIVHLIEETKSYGQKGFRKRLVVLEQDEGRFTNYVPVEFVQDACDSADRLKVGDRVEVTYKLKGRRWQRDPGSEVKFFLNAEATRFQVLGAGERGGASFGDPNSALQEGSDSDFDDPAF